MSYKPVITVVGISGALGAPVLDAITSEQLRSNFSLPIKAVTRKRSKEDTDFITYFEASDFESYKNVLVGSDVVISLTAVPNEELLRAVIATRPKLYIPSQFGADLTKPMFLPFLDLKTQHSKAARDADIKVVDVFCGAFAQGFFLYEFIGHVGADIETKKVRYVGDPHTKFSYSTLIDVGKTVAVLASKEPSTIPDSIRVYSGLTDQESVVKRYEQTHDVKFDTSVLPLHDAIGEIKKQYKEGDAFYNTPLFVFFLQILMASGDGKGMAFISENDREFINPGESIFKWGKF